MERFKLALGIHNHQPVGNFDHVFEYAHNHAYRPFLELVKRYEFMRFSLHQSGILWDWQEADDPAYFELVQQLVDRGQVELMTGGFYEPILIAVPHRDASGQIAMLTHYLHSHFGVQPTGLWLTERIWEPHLPSLLSESGVRYVPIDDTHFIYAGFRPDQLTGPFTTEHEGRAVTLLPIQKKLRYLLPFRKVEDLISELKRQAEANPTGLAVYADDGEKFGVWPGTHQLCFQDGWLRDFFEAVHDNRDWLEVIPLSEATACSSAGRAYLPSASYAEMLHWALPVDANLAYEQFKHWLAEQGQLERFGRFVRGGHWRGFLTKYEEANLIHKKMMAVSDRLAELDTATERNEYLSRALHALYAGQCNCPYWHGVFGGLYLPHLRSAVLSKLVEAEAALRQFAPARTYVEVRDYDADGDDDILVQTKELSAVISPRHGGALRELSLLKHGFSLTDTLTRRREGYHHRLAEAVTQPPEGETASIHDLVLAKEEGLESYLIEDWYVKRCLIDHFFTDDVTLDVFGSGEYGEEGDFIIEPWEHSVTAGDLSVELVRHGHLWRPDGAVPTTVRKKLEFSRKSGRLSVTYKLSTTGRQPTSVRFGIENNFNFQSGHSPDRYVTIDGSRPDDAYLDVIAEHPQASSIMLADTSRGLGVAVSGSRPGNVWRLPIYTVSLSEGGFERVFQGTTIVHLFTLELSDRPVTLRIDFDAGALKRVSEATGTRLAHA